MPLTRGVDGPAATVGDRATLWIAPNAPHTAAFGLYPQEYERRVIAFFDTTVLDHALKPVPRW